MDNLVDTLRSEVDFLRGRIRELEQLLLPEEVKIPCSWGLVNAEKRIFAALTTRDVLTKEMLYQALYSDRMDLDQPPSISCVESHVSKLKAKLKRFDVRITSKRFIGYTLINRHHFAVKGKGAAVNG